MTHFGHLLLAVALVNGIDALAQVSNDAAQTPVPASGKTAALCPHQVAPTMPAKAMEPRIGGVVRVRALVIDGVVKEVVILSGPELYHEAVRAAMVQYKCTNLAAPVHVTQEFNFEFDEQSKVSCPEQVAPTMPRKATQTGKGGRINAQALIVDGVVTEVTILSGPREFHQSVREAMMQYTCTKEAGPAIVQQQFNFSFGREVFSIQQYEPAGGTAGQYSLVPRPLPLDKSYQQLNDREKAQVRDSYLNMKLQDEPPFPVNGLGEIHNALLVGAQTLKVDGRLSLRLLIDKTGTPTSAEVFHTPDVKFGRFAASVGMLTRFKPAVCGGEPCEMDFPVDVQIVETIR